MDEIIYKLYLYFLVMAKESSRHHLGKTSISSAGSWLRQQQDRLSTTTHWRGSGSAGRKASCPLPPVILKLLMTWLLCRAMNQTFLKKTLAWETQLKTTRVNQEIISNDSNDVQTTSTNLSSYY